MSDTSNHRALPPRRRPSRLATLTGARPDLEEDCEADLTAALVEIGRLQATLAVAYDRIELQDIMLREVDHRAKNAFLSTAGLLQLQASSAADPLVSDALLAAKTRLLALAAAHAALTDLGNGDTLALDDLIRAVCENVSRGLADGPADETAGVFLALELTSIQCQSVQAMPIALLAGEALTNAFKHGFPDGRSGTVTVRLWRDHHAVMLSVIDNGLGPPAHVHDGQGAGLMKRVARHLKADLNIIKPPNGGMEVRISLNMSDDGKRL